MTTLNEWIVRGKEERKMCGREREKERKEKTRSQARIGDTGHAGLV